MNTVALLEDLGHEVLEAGSGQEALDLIGENPNIDMLITDQAMPKMTGTQLADLVTLEHADLPIILASDYAELPEDCQPRMVRLGKLFTQEMLEQAIIQAMRSAAHEAQVRRICSPPLLYRLLPFQLARGSQGGISEPLTRPNGTEPAARLFHSDTRDGQAMATQTSKTTLLAALGANTGIAIAKFCGAAYTGSSAMASEGIHSLVDTGNQILLLFGLKDASRPADAPHPFGYGLRLYFWGFVVSVAIFALGSGLSIHEGLEKIGHPTPISHAWVNLVILVVSTLLEGTSLLVAIRAVQKEARNRALGFMETLRTHRDPTLFAVVYEDTAAIAGLLVALAGTVLAYTLNMPVIDGWTSIVIGLILAVAAISLARRCYTLLTGQAADPAIEERLRGILAGIEVIDHVNEVRTMHFGPSDVLLIVSADFRDDTPAGVVKRIVAQVDDRMRDEFEDVRRVYIEAQSIQSHLEVLDDIGEDADALARENVET